jgi:hypothetical protein
MLYADINPHLPADIPARGLPLSVSQNHRAAMKIHHAAHGQRTHQRHAMNPLNTPLTQPVDIIRNLAPLNFATASYLGPTIDLVPKVKIPGQAQHRAVVGTVRFTNQGADEGAIAHHETTVSLADLKVFHDELLRQGHAEQAKKIAALADHMMKGVQENKAEGTPKQEGLSAYYERTVPTAQRDAPVRSDLVDKEGHFKSFAPTPSQGHTHIRAPADKKAPSLS